MSPAFIFHGIVPCVLNPVCLIGSEASDALLYVPVLMGFYRSVDQRPVSCTTARFSLCFDKSSIKFRMYKGATQRMLNRITKARPKKNSIMPLIKNSLK